MPGALLVLRAPTNPAVHGEPMPLPWRGPSIVCVASGCGVALALFFRTEAATAVQQPHMPTRVRRTGRIGRPARAARKAEGQPRDGEDDARVSRSRPDPRYDRRAGHRPEDLPEPDDVRGEYGLDRVGQDIGVTNQMRSSRYTSYGSSSLSRLTQIGVCRYRSVESQKEKLHGLSNSGSADFQRLPVHDGLLYQRVARRHQPLAAPGHTVTGPVLSAVRCHSSTWGLFSLSPPVIKGGGVGSTPVGSTPSADTSGCSAVRLARLLWEQGVAGSNPATPTTLFAIVQSGRLFSTSACAHSSGG